MLPTNIKIKLADISVHIRLQEYVVTCSPPLYVDCALETTKLQTFIYFQARTDRNSLLSKIVWNLLNDHKLVYKNNCLVVLWWWLSAQLSGCICAILELLETPISNDTTSEESEFLISDHSELLTSNYLLVAIARQDRTAICQSALCRITDGPTPGMTGGTNIMETQGGARWLMQFADQPTSHGLIER